MILELTKDIEPKELDAFMKNLEEMGFGYTTHKKDDKTYT